MPNRARRAWLIGAAAVGCLLAAVQIVHGWRNLRPLGHTLAARVNDHEIDADSVARTVTSMQSGARGRIADAHEHVVQRMIDEELLVEHALRSGAADTDPEVRAALVRAAITRINEEAAATPASERELREYFAAHADAYAASARYDVVPLYFESPVFPDLAPAEAEAQAARAALDDGQPIAVVSKRSAEMPFVPAGGAASAATLKNYYGAQATDAVAATPLGSATMPLPFGRGLIVLYVKGKDSAGARDFAGVRELVAADFVRARQEQALERALQNLRREARIETAPNP